MPPATPKKLVHWDTASPSLYNLGSPYFDGSCDTSIDSSSSLDFINSQLVAHGYIPAPGLSLTGVSNEESARVVKCLLALLGQRADDMSRTEDLTTKLRTLTYDHERLKSMYNTANEKSANSEREMNIYKSRQAASLKTLQASENAHKQTSAELQRTRTLLQGVRATHAIELKKKEKEIERTLDKWQKLADVQSKISAAPVGFRCTNAVITEGTEVVGKGQGFLDIALEQAEQARAHLGDENLLLRKLLLRAINEIQNILHQAKCIASGGQPVEESIPMTLSTLFPLAPPDMASDKLRRVLEDLRAELSELSAPNPPANNVSPLHNATPQISSEEVERLQTVIANLKEELARSQKQSLAHVADTQAMFDQFAEDHRIATAEIGDMSVELMSVPLQDEEKERLERLRLELDMERQKFTDAAIRFGKEKTALEAERMKFLDEKRAWQVELMLAEFPPTPAPVSPIRPAKSTLVMPTQKSPHKSPRRTSHKVSSGSPRRSPAQAICVGKAGSSGRKAHRVSRRSLVASPTKPVMSYETEFIPPSIPAPSFTFTAASSSLLPPSTSGSLLPTSFVLPPPSPRASLPTNLALPPLAALPDSPPSSEGSSHTPGASPSTTGPSHLLAPPTTPPAAKRPFPVAKPFALRMMHAYSPAKPSPLSRILSLADSPLTPENGLNLDASLSPTCGPLEVVAEEDEDGGLGYIMNVLNKSNQPPHPTQHTRMSATELGMESPPDTPLQEKVVPTNVAAPLPQLVFGRGKVFHPDPVAKKQVNAVDKGKRRAVEPVTLRAKTSGLSEKENSKMNGRSGKVSPANEPAPVSRRMGSTVASGGKTLPKVFTKPPTASTATTSSTTSRTRTSLKPPIPPIAGGGPRRVPITSADAPSIAVKARKG